MSTHIPPGILGKINKFVNQVVKDEESIGVAKVKKVVKDDVYN